MKKLISISLLTLSAVTVTTATSSTTQDSSDLKKSAPSSWMLQREENAPKYEAIDTILDLEGSPTASERAARTRELLLQDHKSLLLQAERIKTKVYERFDLPKETHERLNKLPFKRFGTLYSKADQDLTLFGIRQTLGFCLDPDIMAAFEAALIKIHLQTEIKKLLPKPLTDEIDYASLTTPQLIAIRNVLESTDSESTIRKKLISLKSPSTPLKLESFASDLETLRAKVSGGQPTSFLVLSALEAMSILLAVLLCFTNFRKDEPVSKADQEIVFSRA